MEVADFIESTEVQLQSLAKFRPLIAQQVFESLAALAMLEASVEQEVTPAEEAELKNLVMQMPEATQRGVLPAAVQPSDIPASVDEEIQQREEREVKKPEDLVQQKRTLASMFPNIQDIDLGDLGSTFNAFEISLGGPQQTESSPLSLQQEQALNNADVAGTAESSTIDEIDIELPDLEDIDLGDIDFTSLENIDVDDLNLDDIDLSQFEDNTDDNATKN